MSGSNKRINQLQAVFDQPPRYGKDFDWTGYSVHDAASVLRRYLNSLPVCFSPCHDSQPSRAGTDVVTFEACLGPGHPGEPIPRLHRRPA